MYDYGQGGIWSFIDAPSAQAIEDKFPTLKVILSPPDWMTDEMEQSIRRSMHFDIDEPNGWLLTVSSKA